MTPPQWMTGLLRARQTKEDSARHSLAFAKRAAKAAHEKARREADRIAELQAQTAERNAGAFVAAAVALQSAAASHAAAVGAAHHADTWTAQRESAVTAAAVARLSAERLVEQERAEARRKAMAAVQLEMDEIGQTVYRRSQGGAR